MYMYIYIYIYMYVCVWFFSRRKNRRRKIRSCSVNDMIFYIDDLWCPFGFFIFIDETQTYLAFVLIDLVDSLEKFIELSRRIALSFSLRGFKLLLDV